MDSSPDPLASIYSSLSSGVMIESSSDLSPLSAFLRVSENIFPSSTCMNMIILSVSPLKDVAQVVYITDVRIATAYELVCDIYANTLKKLPSTTTSYEDIIFLVLGTYIRFPF